MSRPKNLVRPKIAPLASALTASLVLAGCGATSSTTSQGEAKAVSASGAATSSEASVTIVDAQKRSVQVPRDPEVVVATDWSVVRTLTELGVEVDAVPKASTALPADLAKYADGQVKTVGTLRELDYEAINELEPDVVFVGSRSGTTEVVKEIEKITPTVVDMSARFTNADEQLPATRERVEQLGEVFGKKAEASALMTAAEQQLKTVEQEVSAKNLSAAFVQVSGGKASAYGPGSRFGIVYDGMGFKDTGAKIDPTADHGQEVSQEFFAQYNPGALLVLDRSATIGAKGEKSVLQVLNNDLVAATDAAKNKRIKVVDGFSWYIASAAPASITQMAADAKAVAG